MKKTLLYSLVIASCALSANAQIGGLVNQVENTQTRNELTQSAQKQAGQGDTVPQLYEGESGDVGPQSVVQAPPRHTLFATEADAQFFYTDNMFLTQNGKQSTGVLLSTAQFALAPTPFELWNGALAPQLGYRAQWFNFGLDGGSLKNPSIPLRDFDFNAQTVFANALWTRGHWSFGAGLDATKLFTMDYDSFYQELAPEWVAKFTLPIGNRMAFSASYQGDYHVTDIHPLFADFSTSDASDRTDHALLLTYTQLICKHVVFEPYYQFKYTHYTDYPLGTRNDYLNSLGAGVYWLICPNFSIRTYVNYDILRTDNSAVPQYHKLDAGGGINLTFRF